MSVSTCSPQAGLLSLALVCSLTASTVSPGGAPDGEGNTAGHDPAAPANKGDRRRGHSFPFHSWCSGGTGLRCELGVGAGEGVSHMVWGGVEAGKG